MNICILLKLTSDRVAKSVQKVISCDKITHLKHWSLFMVRRLFSVSKYSTIYSSFLCVKNFQYLFKNFKRRSSDLMILLPYIKTNAAFMSFMLIRKNQYIRIFKVKIVIWFRFLCANKWSHCRWTCRTHVILTDQSGERRENRGMCSLLSHWLGATRPASQDTPTS